MKKITSLLAVLAFAAWAGTANAGVIINVSEIGGDVVVSATGSLDLTGANSVLANAGYNNLLISGGSNWFMAPGSGGAYVSYAMTSLDGAFGTSPAPVGPSSSTGDNFFIWSGFGSAMNQGNEQVAVTAGYAGEAISSGMVFDNATFATLSLTPGTYNFTIPNDTITLNIGGRVVPEPTTLTIFGSICLVACGRRRKS